VVKLRSETWPRPDAEGKVSTKWEENKMKKLFYLDSLQDICMARVTRIDGNIVELDQTILFAFSGGQASDKGTIGSIEVIEAKKIDENTIEYYLAEEPSFKVGDEVEVKIDLENRKRLMCLHSAAHIVCFLFEKITGIHYSKCVGSNVDSTKSRLDYELDHNISVYFEKLTEEANKIFQSDHPINTFANKDDPNRREWECPSLNQACPCGGTHVSNTNQIGEIKLKRKNIGKGKERIEIILLNSN
jgi:alanyl-tRNA synthetase